MSNIKRLLHAQQEEEQELYQSYLDFAEENKELFSKLARRNVAEEKGTEKTYLLENTITGDTYVGVTRDTLKRRLICHKCRANKGKHNHLPLYQSINEHGLENFTVNVLSLGDKEKFFCDTLSPSLNLTRGGRGGCGEISERCKEATSQANSKVVLCVETGEVFSSATLAEKEKGCGDRTISAVLRGKTQTAGGFHWKLA